MSLSGAESEQQAGDFYVDLVGEDEDGNAIVIENQLERSDHEHLGKIITYMTALEAKAAIWIVADPRPEHIKAVAWLNESIEPSFYLVKVEAVRIGDSPPAPLLTLIVGPSEEGREVGETKKGLAERHILRHDFWSMLLEKASERTQLHAKISPSKYHWIGTSAGKRGLQLSYIIRKHEAMIEFYIDRGKDSTEENKAIFEQLLKKKDEIEAAFGDALTWQRLEGKRASRISKTITLGGYRDGREKWPEIQDAMVDAMVGLSAALKPYIARLKI